MDDVRRDQEEIEKVEEIPSQEIEKELSSLKELSKQLDNNYKRALADYQNLQRRTQEEKADWIRMATKDFILKLLPVFDTLMLATKHLNDKGLSLSVDQFLKVLSAEGVTRIETTGQDFDPMLMEVVTTKEVDKKDKGKVIEEVRTGFLYNETVIRPAQVIVGQ